MNQQETTDTIARRARLARVSISALCKMAGVAPSTFSRWRSVKKPVSANFATMTRLIAIIDELEEENARS